MCCFQRQNPRAGSLIGALKNERRISCFREELPYLFATVASVRIWRLPGAQGWEKSLLQELHS
jgi:hypothetical protein